MLNFYLYFCVQLHIKCTVFHFQQMSAAAKNYPQQSRSRTGSSGTAAQYPGVYPTTTMQAQVAQAQPPPPLVRATVHSNQPNLG